MSTGYINSQKKMLMSATNNCVSVVEMAPILGTNFSNENDKFVFEIVVCECESNEVRKREAETCAYAIMQFKRYIRFSHSW